jgi:hypothetical protein
LYVYTLGLLSRVVRFQDVIERRNQGDAKEENWCGKMMDPPARSTTVINDDGASEDSPSTRGP